MGINDTKKLLPWSIATVTLGGVVRIDASKQMVLASPETPSDLSMLNSGDHTDRVYKAFDVPAPRFEPRETVSGITPDENNAWSARGPIISGIERDSHRSMSGRVIGMSEVQFQGGVRPARALTIRLTDDDREELVLLGPSAYMDNQKAICRTGDTVKLDACRTTVGGQRYWITKSIDCKDSRVELLDRNYAPAWAQR